MAGRTGVTYEDFVVAADAIALADLPLTYASLRDKLNGGSNSTIGDYLEIWRKSKVNNLPSVTSLVLPIAIAKAIKNWADGELTNVVNKSALEMKEQVRLRELLEKETDLIAIQWQDEKDRVIELDIENQRLLGRISQLEVESGKDRAEKENVDAKLITSLVELAVITEKLASSQKEQSKNDIAYRKIEAELDEMRALERATKDAATVLEIKIEESIKLRTSVEDRLKDRDSFIANLEQQVASLQDAVNDASKKVTESEIYIAAAQSHAMTRGKWMKSASPQKHGNFKK
jgi:hypothetical protein